MGVCSWCIAGDSGFEDGHWQESGRLLVDGFEQVESHGPDLHRGVAEVRQAETDRLFEREATRAFAKNLNDNFEQAFVDCIYLVGDDRSPTQSLAGELRIHLSVHQE